MLFKYKTLRAAAQLEKSKQWAEAAELYLQVLSPSTSESARWLYRCAFTLFQLQRWAESERYLAMALQKRPKKAQWHYRYSLVLRHLGKLSDAEDALEKALQINPKAFQSWGRSMPQWKRLEILQQSVGRWQQRHESKAHRAWIAVTMRLGIGAGAANLFYRLAKALEIMNRFEEAAINYKQAIALKAGKIPVDWYYDKGYCYQRAAEEGVDTLRLAQQAYAVVQKHSAEAERFGIGFFHQKKGRWLEAQQAYQIQLKTHPTDAELLYRLGMSFDRHYHWSQAEKYYKQSVKLDSKHANRWYRLGFVLERQANYQAAAEAYEKATKVLTTQNTDYFYRWAYCLEQLACYEQAADVYLQSLVVEPMDVKLLDIYKLRAQLARENIYSSEGYYRLGQALARLGQYEEACKAFRETRITQKATGLPSTRLSKDRGLNQVVTYTEFYEREAIQSHWVLYESFHGAAMSCNPYALFLWLWEQDTEQKYTHIWVVNEPENVKNKYKNQKNIIFVERDSDLYKRYISSAKYLINNNTFPPYFIRKPGQVYLNTWHGTPLKTLGKDIKEGFFEYQNATRNFLQASYLLSPNTHTTQVLVEQHNVQGILSAEMLEKGYPRIDLTLDAKQSDQIRKQLKLDSTKKAVLYAPTYRGSTLEISEFEEAPINQLLTELSKDDSLEVFFRGHHKVEASLAEAEISARVVPYELDTNVFLSVVDVLITDYSSILFDFLPSKKPIILYAYDYEEYIEKRGLYLEKEEIPGVFCTSVAQVIEAVKKSEQGIDVERWQYHIERYCPFDDGQVASRVWQKLMVGEELKKVQSSKKSILIYAGALMLNGITVSLKNLLRQLDAKRYTIYLAIEPTSFVTPDQFEQLEALFPYVYFLPKFDRVNWTLEEHWLMLRFHEWHHLPTEEMRGIIKKAYQREARRLYGVTNFDTVINFEGYVRYWALLFSTMPNNTIYLHNDMYSEWRTRFPAQESVFNLYSEYTYLISVSKSTNDQNRKQLSTRYGIDNQLFSYVDNTINPEVIIEESQEEINEKVKTFIADAQPLFINIARLSIEKGHEQLLYAFRKAVDQQPSAKLLIVGGGPLMNELLELIKHLKLENNVMLPGLLSNPFPYLSAADCFVFSSKHEGQGLALLEAMVLRKPIICTDFPCAHDVLEHGKYGVIVENSSLGLQKGMLNFLKKPYLFPIFDYHVYQKQAISQFKQYVLNE